MEGSSEPIIGIKCVQLSNKLGQLVMDSLDSKRGPAQLLNTHHTCYKINSIQSARVLMAARRFSDKAKSGRYSYQHGGGIKARLQTRPGTRGVNCGDFVIKVLREAGIASLGYKYLSTPYRVASPI